MPNRPRVLLSDADVLIDYRDSDRRVVQRVHVVRDVVDEVDDEPRALLGLTVIEVEPQAEALTLRSSFAPRVPRERLNLCYQWAPSSDLQ